MEVNRDREIPKLNLGVTCIKYLLFFLNVVFVIASFVAVSSGVSTIVALTSYYSMMSYGFQTLTTFWLVVGIFFMIVALFGIFAAFKESTALANMYGIAMMLVFVLQVAASITSFTLISKSRYMVSSQLDQMMRSYSYAYRLELDWIQAKFECCGNNGPSDWQNFGRFSTPNPYDWYYRTIGYGYRTETTYDDWYREQSSPEDGYSTEATTQTSTTTTEAPRTDLMPASCCVQYSNYVNLSCEQYHSKGCFEPIHEIVSESIMVIGSSALVFSVLQIFGIVLGFTYARIIRSKKTQRDVKIWNSGQREGSSLPGYSPVHH